MAKRLTPQQEFSTLSDSEKYVLLNKTETEVQRLRRITDGLLLWKEDSVWYNELVEEYKEYLEEE